jgi:hypothetical protein
MQDIIISNDQEIVLTPFETEQGWSVKIDLKTNNIWVTTTDLETLLGIAKDTLKPGRSTFGKVLELLRNDGLSEDRKDLKITHNSGAVGRGQCYDEDQLFCILEGFNPPMYKQSKKFGVKTAIMQACGLLEKPRQPQLTASEAIKMMLPSYELAEQNPGISQLASKVHTIPCLIIHDRTFSLRFWTNIHFPGVHLSRRALTRLGRQIAATYQQHKLTLPVNGYTDHANRYTKQDHELICQIFQTMFDAGQLD